LEIQEEAGDRLRVLELADPRAELGDRPAHDLDVLVLLRLRLAGVDVLGEEQVHLLAAEARRRPEGRELRPRPAAQAALLAQLALRTRERLLPVLADARRQLEQRLARGLAELRDEPDLVLAVDGDDRDGLGVLDDLALVRAPLLDRHVDQLAVVDGARLVGRHAASRSTSARSSGPNQGGEPAAAFSAVRSG